MFLNFEFATSESEEKATADKSNGLGEAVDWTDWDSALDDGSKPLMVILHKTWCPACKSLKPKLAESKEFARLSRSFSMINGAEGDKIHDIEKLTIDGQYVPRIHFLDQEGNLLPDIYNEDGNPNYKFYYYTEESVVKAMQRALKATSVQSSSSKKSNGGDSKEEL